MARKRRRSRKARRLACEKHAGAFAAEAAQKSSCSSAGCRQRTGAEGRAEDLNPYTLLVAVVLSAQATDAGVNRATKPLFAKVDTPQKMLALRRGEAIEAIRSLGFFNMKAKNVMRAVADPR